MLCCRVSGQKVVQFTQIKSASGASIQHVQGRITYMSGTPFTAEQVDKIHSLVTIAVAAALPKVVAKYDDPSLVLKNLGDRGNEFAQHIETALEEAVNRTLVLIRHRQVSLLPSPGTSLEVFGRKTNGIYPWTEFSKNVLLRAKPIAPSTRFEIGVVELARNATNEEIIANLSGRYAFEADSACAVIAELAMSSGAGTKVDLLNDKGVNIFFIGPLIVSLYRSGDKGDWRVDAYRDNMILKGSRIFCLL